MKFYRPKKLNSLNSVAIYDAQLSIQTKQCSVGDQLETNVKTVWENLFFPITQTFAKQ